MSIKVQLNSKRSLGQCFSCKEITGYWYKGVACCNLCAIHLNAKNIPSKDEQIANEKTL